MPPSRKPSQPIPVRKVATLADLRGKPLFTQYVSFVTKDVPEPKDLPAIATAEQRAERLKLRAEWEQAVEEATRELKIQAMPRRKFRELRDAHPPTEAQVKRSTDRGLQEPEYDEDTYPPALIAASVVEPEGVTLEDAKAIWDDWEQGSANLLFAACLSANVSLERLDFYQKKSAGTSG